ncbi:MAG: hypothetical protein HYZ42_16595 [Bacteroidetes bacterium]|nr:hypothetical protein [Bacteroidota bacterium]
MFKLKIKEWIKRYWLTELVGTITALSSAYIAHIYDYDLLLVAYIGSIGEAVGFYTTVFIQNLIRINKKCKKEHRAFSFTDLYKTMIQIALEFGLAGVIDDLLVRPFFMYIFPLILNNFILGILIGKFVGDFVFYLLVIMSYEGKQWYMRKKENNI